MPAFPICWCFRAWVQQGLRLRLQLLLQNPICRGCSRNHTDSIVVFLRCSCLCSAHLQQGRRLHPCQHVLLPDLLPSPFRHHRPLCLVVLPLCLLPQRPPATRTQTVAPTSAAATKSVGYRSSATAGSPVGTARARKKEACSATASNRVQGEGHAPLLAATPAQTTVSGVLAWRRGFNWGLIEVSTWYYWEFDWGLTRSDWVLTGV